MSTPEALPYGEVLRRVGELAESLCQHPDRHVAAQVEELLDWVDAFHRDGLGRLVEMVRSWRGEIFLDAAAADEIVGTFLGAYGLGTVGDGLADVDAALDAVRPLIESHGGSIVVETVLDGVVTVRLDGTCDGCPSSAATLTYGVEEALRERWANFRRLEVASTETEIDPEKFALACVTGSPPPPPAPAPMPPLLQIKGHELR